MCSLPRPTKMLTHHPVDVGEASEAIAVAELIRRGHEVLVPHGTNHRYDLVIETGDRFIRVQVKTGRLRDGVVKFATASVRANMRKAQVRHYIAGEIDAFLVVCQATNGLYWVPLEEAARGHMALRVSPCANNQGKKIRWAADYELPPPELSEV